MGLYQTPPISKLLDGQFLSLSTSDRIGLKSRRSTVGTRCDLHSFDRYIYIALA